jgi:kynurenine formamidase
VSEVIRREEPIQLQDDAYRRFEVFGVQIAGDPAGEEGWGYGSQTTPHRDFGSPIRLFNSHLGTHMRIPHEIDHFGDGALLIKDAACLSTEQLIGPACVIDLTQVGPRQRVTRRAVEAAGADIRPGDIALLWTGYSDQYYTRPDFLALSPLFDIDALEWILDRGAKMIVSDTARLEPHPWDGFQPSAVDNLLRERQVPVVTCAANLWMLRQPRCFAICSPTPLDGLPTSPTRVVAVEQYPVPK